MTLRWALVFLLIFGVEAFRAALTEGNNAPEIGDAAEVHNIAYSLAHGRGYSFDWNDEQWRKLWQEQNADGRFDFVLVRRGSYPTMFRPPLMPLLVGAILKMFPHDSFLAWRVFDSAGFAAAACLLCDVAFLEEGMIGLFVLLVILVSDPLRRAYVPGWLTEGLAFDFLSLIVWLIASGGRMKAWWYNICAGLAMGLLCLDRSIFLLAMPFICLALAMARSRPWAGMFKNLLIILGVSVLIQIPWWARNITVSGRLVPLGTQGGFNLPDEYSDVALQEAGVWTGRGLRDAWIPQAEANHPTPIPPGLSEESFRKLWPSSGTGDANQLRSAATLYAAVCVSLQSEIVVSSAGQQAAIAWVRNHYTKVPMLMAEKVVSLTFSRRRYLAVTLLFGVIGLFNAPKPRRVSYCLASLIASYVLAIALTHVVYGRFLVPILPSLYIAMVWGIAAIARRVRQQVFLGPS
jgi:hypothetical protein